MKLTFVHGYDWEGLYIDGALAVQGQHLSAKDVLQAIGAQRESLDEAWISNVGFLPESLSEVKIED